MSDAESVGTDAESAVTDAERVDTTYLEHGHRDDMGVEELREGLAKYLKLSEKDESDIDIEHNAGSQWNQVDFDNKLGVQATLVDGHRITIQGVSLCKASGVLRSITVNGQLLTPAYGDWGCAYCKDS